MMLIRYSTGRDDFVCPRVGEDWVVYRDGKLLGYKELLSLRKDAFEER